MLWQAKNQKSELRPCALGIWGQSAIRSSLYSSNILRLTRTQRCRLAALWQSQHNDKQFSLANLYAIFWKLLVVVEICCDFQQSYKISTWCFNNCCLDIGEYTCISGITPYCRYWYNYLPTKLHKASYSASWHVLAVHSTFLHGSQLFPNLHVSIS